MKKISIVITFLLLCLNINAQTLEPEFSFQLYFEDAAGSRDTITLGYDSLATWEIDTIFGEINTINEPLPSDEFQVWIDNSVDKHGTFRTKTQIFKNDCNNNWSNFWFTHSHIKIKNAEFPISVSINKALGDNPCLNKSYLWEDGEPTWEVSLLLHIMVPELTYILSEPMWFNLVAYEDDDGKIIYQYVLTFLGSTSGISTKTKNNLSISPNPFAEGFQINCDGVFKNIQLVDLSGKKMDFERNKNTIYPKNCSPGIYFLSFETDEGIFNYKIIKK